MEQSGPNQDPKDPASEIEDGASLSSGPEVESFFEEAEPLQEAQGPEIPPEPLETSFVPEEKAYVEDDEDALIFPEANGDIHEDNQPEPIPAAVEPPKQSQEIAQGPSTERPLTPLAGSMIHFVAMWVSLAASFGALLLGGLLFGAIASASGYVLTLIIGMTLVLALLPVLQIWVPAAFVRWSLQSFNYPQMKPWSSRLSLVAVQVAYMLLLLLLGVACIPFLLLFPGAKAAVVVGVVVVIVWTLSLLWLPGRILQWSYRWKEKTSKILVWITVASNCAGVLLVGSAGAALYAIKPQEKKPRYDLVKEESIARNSLQGAAQIVQNFSKVYPTNNSMADYLCKTGYGVAGTQKDCHYTKVAPTPWHTEPADLPHLPKQIWLQTLKGGTNLCSVGGGKAFCVFVQPQIMGYGWSSFSFLTAQGNAQQNLGWPVKSVSRKQSEIENALDRIIGQIKK